MYVILIILGAFLCWKYVSYSSMSPVDLPRIMRGKGAIQICGIVGLILLIIGIISFF